MRNKNNNDVKLLFKESDRRNLDIFLLSMSMTQVLPFNRELQKLIIVQRHKNKLKFLRIDDISMRRR